jgi:hypothetical protein
VHKKSRVSIGIIGWRGKIVVEQEPNDQKRDDPESYGKKKILTSHSRGGEKSHPDDQGQPKLPQEKLDLEFHVSIPCFECESALRLFQCTKNYYLATLNTGTISI